MHILNLSAELLFGVGLCNCQGKQWHNRVPFAATDVTSWKTPQHLLASDRVRIIRET